jgi:hypothetical protein
MNYLNYHHVATRCLRPGMRLFGWTRQAIKVYGPYASLQDGPDEGPYEGMVIANVIQEPREIDGVGYPDVHRIDVLFWNESGRIKLHTFHWTSGTTTRVID